MTGHPSYEELNDFADALLGNERAETIASHVASCAECARTVREIRALHEQAGALPREMDPPEMIWSAIRAATVDTAPMQRGPVLWQKRHVLTAAAIMLLVMGSSFTWWLTQQRARDVIATNPPAMPTHVDLASNTQVDASYDASADALKKLLEQRRTTMDTAVVRTVEENLKLMDEAIERARAALLSDPSNQDIAGILAAAQESRIRMLDRAVRMRGRT